MPRDLCCLSCFSKARPSEILPWIIPVVTSGEEGSKILEGDMRNSAIRHRQKEQVCH